MNLHFARRTHFDPARFVRQQQAVSRSRRPRGEFWTNVYTLVLVGAAIAAWIWGIAGAVGAQVGDMMEAAASGKALYRDPAPWMGPGAPWPAIMALLLLSWLGLIRSLLTIGPVGVAPDRAWWVWRLPVTRSREPLRALGRLTLLTGVAAALVGAILGFVAQAAVTPAPVGVLASAAGGGVAGTAAVLVAAYIQALRAGVHRIRQIPGWELRRAGAASRHLRNAISLGSGSEVRSLLSGAGRPDLVRSNRGIPNWVSGPHRVAVYAAFAAQRSSGWGRRALLDTVVVAVLLIGFTRAVIPAAWVALVFIAYRGLGRGTAYLLDLRAGTAAERLLPMSGTAMAALRLVVPCVCNAIAMALTSVIAGLVTQAPLLPLLAIGVVAGLGVGVTVAYRALAPAPDLTEPPIETPAGALPRSQLAAAVRGLVLLPLLASAPATALLFPHLWVELLVAALVLTLVAGSLALTSGARA